MVRKVTNMTANPCAGLSFDALSVFVPTVRSPINKIIHNLLEK